MGPTLLLLAQGVPAIQVNTRHEEVMSDLGGSILLHRKSECLVSRPTWRAWSQVAVALKSNHSKEREERREGGMESLVTL